MSETSVTLARDVQAIEIPSGYPLALAAGAKLMITQSLGGNFTVMTEDGYLARVDGKDADALGQQASAKQALGEGATLEERVWEQLEQVYDPEIPVSIVELGLIYGVELKPGEKGSHAFVRMTMTAPGCGMGDILKDEVEQRLSGLPGIESVEVEIVLDPPWDPSLMSEAARLQLGMF